MVVAGGTCRGTYDEACVGQPQEEEEILAPAQQNLKSLPKALRGFSYVYHADGLKNTLFSQGRIFEVVQAMGTVDRVCTARAGEGVRSPGPA